MTAAATPPPRRGRPRDPALDAAVLAATAHLLRERGYQRLRVADVAERAGVGLGALYRRWPGKRELVLAAVADAVPDRAVPTTDDPAGDVLAGLRAIAAALGGPARRLLGSVLPEMEDDPELAAAVRDGVLAAVRRGHRDRLRRLVGDVPDLDVRADVGPAYLLLRTVVLGEDVGDTELRALLHLVAAPGGGP